MFNDIAQNNRNNQSVKIDAQETLIEVNKEFLFNVINAHLESIKEFRKQRTEKTLRLAVGEAILVKENRFSPNIYRNETKDESHNRLLKNGTDWTDGDQHEYPCKCWTKTENTLKSLLLCPESETTITLPVSFYKLILEFSAFSRRD